MSDTHARLIGCFQAVFPELNDSDAARANTNRVGKWDSVTHLFLVSAIEEEFGFQFGTEEIEELTSFDAFVSRIERRTQ